MSALDLFIETENDWAKMFGWESVERPTTAEGCKIIFLKLEGELSPENLHCDGEISAEQAQRKSDHFLAVWKELEEIAGEKRQLFGVWV